ncbi:rhomboid family intramembrane serine protease [Halobellus ruber]|uniref:Rhomboid family intramembrane serine protease n=1 Tax=Halobellus ruber TaxID=2761102 RepID=A0A7J9SIA9_9EURY|nr:rhomboid family intramembrane serine protease [Halobellus ruber]MBB6645869.1 rhomboid family intramembrane serine protease [Halobellus ruber]
MPPERGPDERVADIVAGGREVASEFRELEAPVTRSVVSVVVFVFVGQALAGLKTGMTIPALVRYLFAEHAVVAWTLSPVLHYGGLHFLFNVVTIWGVGAIVEQTLSRRRYVSLLVLAAVGSTAASYLAKAPFGAVQTSTYGSSGIAYAVATYSVARESEHGVSDLQELASTDGIARIAGMIAILLVAYDIAAGPYAAANWFNGSHLGGAVVGLVSGQYLS